MERSKTFQNDLYKHSSLSKSQFKSFIDRIEIDLNDSKQKISRKARKQRK